MSRFTIDDLTRTLKQEAADANYLYRFQSRDSRIGFEASNQYYYVPLDLIEKVVNCRDLLDRWIPELRKQYRLKEGPPE